MVKSITSCVCCLTHHLGLPHTGNMAMVTSFAMPSEDNTDEHADVMT